MGQVQVLRLSNRHQAILEHMIANPTDKLGDVAALFGLSQAWLSTLVHSDAFQEELRKKRGEVFHPAMMDLRERMTGMAHLLLDKVGERVENDKFNNDQLLDASSSVLDRLGYGTKGSGGGGNQGGVTVNIGGAVPAGVLSEARERWGTVQRIDESEGERDEASDYSNAPQVLPASGNRD